MTKDNFPEFCKLKLTKVYIMTDTIQYGYEYYIYDPKKIEVIKMCIQHANQFEYNRERFKKNRQAGKDKNHETLIFETSKVMYTMCIAWNDEYVYGLWWESADLLYAFKKWNLFAELSKADPAWPGFRRKPLETKPNVISRRIENPPKESDPNFPGVQRFEPNSS